MPVDSKPSPSLGLNSLLSAAPDATQFLAADQATWQKWAARPSLQLWQAVFLHSSVDPDSLGFGAGDVLHYFVNLDGVAPDLGVDPDIPVMQLMRNLSTACDAIKAGALPRAGDESRHPETDEVRVGEFYAWAMRSKLPIVSGWQVRADSSPAPKQSRNATADVNISELPESGLIREAQLVPGIVPISPATLWRWVRAGDFPQPVKLAKGVTAWRVEDVRAWRDGLGDGKKRAPRKR